MKEYKNSDELIAEIQKRANLFISEFENIPNDKKNMLIDGVDKTPTQMISYQLGWMRLIQKWEQENQGNRKIVWKEG